MSKTPIGGPLRRDLEAALTTDEFRKAFEDLKTKDEVFRKYPTVEALVALCQPGAPDPEGRDRTLGSILRALKRDNALFPLLHLMFWVSLSRLHAKLAKRTRDPESLFEQLQFGFFQTVGRYDPDRSPRKIDVNLFLNTKQAVMRWLRRGSRENSMLEHFDPNHEARRTWRVLEEISIPAEELEAFLLDLFQRGLLKPSQHEVVLDTDVYRRESVREWAKRKGISLITAHTHRQAAYRAIRKHLGLPEGGMRKIGDRPS